MDDLLMLLPLITFISACLVSAFSSIQALYALRAKKRVRKIIARRAKKDAQFFDFRKRADTHELTPQEYSVLRDTIEELLAEVSAADKKFVERGLNQPSRLGVERYVNDLLTHA